MANKLGGKVVLFAAASAEATAGDVWQAEARIEEAVLSVASAIISQGGRIAMIWHEAFSPLVAQIALQNQRPRLVEGQVLDDPHPPQARLVAYRSPRAESQADSFSDGEAVEVKNLPGATSRRQRRRGRRPAADVPSAIARIIVEQAPLAFVALGGGNELGQSISTFLERTARLPVFLFETTGADAAYHQTDSNRIVFLDRFLSDLDEADLNQKEDADLMRIVPYPLVAQLLIEAVGRL